MLSNIVQYCLVTVTEYGSTIEIPVFNPTLLKYIRINQGKMGFGLIDESLIVRVVVWFKDINAQIHKEKSGYKHMLSSFFQGRVMSIQPGPTIRFYKDTLAFVFSWTLNAGQLWDGGIEDFENIFCHFSCIVKKTGRKK